MIYNVFKIEIINLGSAYESVKQQNLDIKRVYADIYNCLEGKLNRRCLLSFCLVYILKPVIYSDLLGVKEAEQILIMMQEQVDKVNMEHGDVNSLKEELKKCKEELQDLPMMQTVVCSLIQNLT